MKHGGTRAFLTEFVVVILFFALAAMISLRIFAYSNTQSAASLTTNLAVAELQDIGEHFREAGLASFNTDNGWQGDDRLFVKETNNFVITAECAFEPTPDVPGGMITAVISIIENKNGGRIIMETTLFYYVQYDYEVPQ